MNGGMEHVQRCSFCCGARSAVEGCDGATIRYCKRLQRAASVCPRGTRCLAGRLDGAVYEIIGATIRSARSLPLAGILTPCSGADESAAACLSPSSPRVRRSDGFMADG
jgi:hypothetical protein